jgi:hypothetical protein
VIDGKRVVVWTPYGRAKTVSILINYLQRDHDKGLIDEYWLCLNMDPGQTEDAAWALRTAGHRDWVKLKERPPGVTQHERKQRNTGYFYRYMTDPDTIFVRMDDDLVYVHEDAVERLVLHKLVTPQLCSFPMIINNAICSHFLQADGKIPMSWGKVKASAFDGNGWNNGQFAIDLHEMFLDRIQTGTVPDLFSHMDYEIPLGKQFSVSCFASEGKTYAELDPPGVLMPDQVIEEESWHTQIRPRMLRIPNVIVGNAFVSHYSFFTQHDHLAGTDILTRYRDLSEQP